MTPPALGTWRKPPLAYVVAEVRISPYYSMTGKIPSLQDRLRAVYPRTIEATELVVEGSRTSPQPLWQLLAEEQRHGIQFGTRAISLHATTYLQSSDFLSRWAEVLDAIQQASLGAFVERVGLRYVDLIVPDSDRAPADYLVQQLQGITLPGTRSTGLMWAAAFQFDDSRVTLRAAVPSPKGMVLPPDFNTLPLTKPAVMVEAERRVNEEKPVGFIDTDCNKDVNRVFSSSELMTIYTEMQTYTSRTFKATLSTVAQEEWM